MTVLFYAHVKVKGTGDYTFVAIYRREDGTYKVRYSLNIVSVKNLRELKSFLKALSGGSARNMHPTQEVTQREINAIWEGLFH